MNEETTTAQQQRAEKPTDRRKALIAIGVAVVLLAVPGIWLLSTGRQPDPRNEPEGWEEPDLDGAKSVDLGTGDFRAVVVIGADDKTCWNGYIASEALEGCGKRTYTVTGSKASLGMNARAAHPDKRFIGLAVWDGDGEQLLENLSQTKKYATVVLNIGLPPDV